MMVIALIILCALTASANVDVLLGNRSQRTYSQGVGNNMVASWGTPDVLDGIVGWWKMDESSWNGTDGEVADSSGKNNYGTSLGGATTTPGKISNCGIFNGSSAFVNITKTDWPIVTNITLSVWIKSSVESLYAQVFIWGLPVGDVDRIFGVRMDNGALMCEIGTYSQYKYFYSSGTTKYTDGAWHHVALVYDSQKCKLYIDNVMDAEISITGGLNFSGSHTNKVVLGGTGTYFYNGLIDDARIYNRALSAEEVGAIYNRYK